MGIFDWLFGDTDDEDTQLEDVPLMDMDDEDDQIFKNCKFPRVFDFECAIIK